MGVLSGLFAGSRGPNASYVRSWAERRERELRHCNKPSPEYLFACMMYGLTSFVTKEPEQSIPSESKRIAVSEPYYGDGALFELGCYIYVRFDTWLFVNKPHRRKEISTTFAREFVELFGKALSTVNIRALFEQRVSKYGELIREGADVRKYHFYLCELILRTRGNRPPESYDFDNEPLVLDAIAKVGVEIALSNWELHMIPVLIQSLEAHCLLTDG